MERYIESEKIERVMLSEEGKNALETISDMIDEINEVLNSEIITVNKVYNNQISHKEFDLMTFEEMVDTLRFATSLDTEEYEDMEKLDDEEE